MLQINIVTLSDVFMHHAVLRLSNREQGMKKKSIPFGTGASGWLWLCFIH